MDEIQFLNKFYNHWVGSDNKPVPLRSLHETFGIEKAEAIKLFSLLKNNNYLQLSGSNVIITESGMQYVKTNNIHLDKTKEKGRHQETFGFDSKNIEYLEIWKTIHPSIRGFAEPRFQSGYYADAVENSFKIINMRIKTAYKNKTGMEMDGVDLMNQAFTTNSGEPVFRIDNIDTVTGKDIHKGYHQLFVGSITALRNPKAHEIITLEPLRAILMISLASLLMFKLDDMKMAPFVDLSF
jgi:uncharacterized protein (TIGR02391 family)